MLVHERGKMMNKDLLIVVRHGPYGGFQAAEGLRHMNGAMSFGFKPIFVLIADGIYLAKQAQDPGESQWLSLGGVLEEIMARSRSEMKEAPAKFYIEKESLIERELNPESLIKGLELIDHKKVSELLENNHLQLIF